jgi:hypothetical protein
MHRFPVIGRHHFDRIPRAAVKECAIWSFADALLTSDTEIRVYFDAPEWRMIFIGHPEHARFDGAVLDASRRTGATGTTVGSDRKNSWPLLARRFAVSLGHWPMLFYNVVHALFVLPVFTKVAGHIQYRPPLNSPKTTLTLT